MALAGLAHFVTYNPRVVSPSATLIDALELMERFGCHHLPVVDQSRHVIGLVSDLDVALALNGAKIHPRKGAPPLPATGATVSAIMATRVVTLGDDATPSQALATLLDNEFHSVPVVSREGELLGMITSTDFLREISYGELASSAQRIGDHWAAVRDTLDAAAPLEEALEILDDDWRQWIMVVRQGLPLGVLSLRDIHRAQMTSAGHVSPATGWPVAKGALTVGQVFAGQPVIFTLGQTLAEGAACMIERSMRAVAVADDCMLPVGVLREDDILAALAQPDRSLPSSTDAAS